MARVRPFRAYTYARQSVDITSVTSPPYDVVSEQQRADLLAGDTHNVVALELPEGPLDPKQAGNRYETGAKRWLEWTTNGTLIRDEVPTLYVLEQKYETSNRTATRRALITEVGLESFDAGVILPHERTLPKALGDRYSLIEATAANFSQVLGLYPDEENHSAALFERAMQGDPTMTAMDAEGIESRVWAVTDTGIADEFATLMSEKPIFIADGHHRYTTALAYRDARREADVAIGATTDDPSYDFVMMALVNMDDPDLIVLPTHRVADADSNLDPDAFFTALDKHFDVTALDDEKAHSVLKRTERPAFIIKVRGNDDLYLAQLRSKVDLDTIISTEHSSAWKHLDVAVLQELILDPILGIHPDRPETLARLTFVKDPHDAMKMVGKRDTAFILRPTGKSQMRTVSLAGDVMPQKSTYFYPKILSGLVLRGMD